MAWFYFIYFWLTKFIDFCSFGCWEMDTGPNGEEPTSWEELYSINLMPSELSFKFRKEVQGLRVGVNLEVLSFDFYKILTRFMFKFLEFIRCAYYRWRKVFFFLVGWVWYMGIVIQKEAVEIFILDSIWKFFWSFCTKCEKW